MDEKSYFTQQLIRIEHIVDSFLEKFVIDVPPFTEELPILGDNPESDWESQAYRFIKEVGGINFRTLLRNKAPCLRTVRRLLDDGQLASTYTKMNLLDGLEGGDTFEVLVECIINASKRFVPYAEDLIKQVSDNSGCAFATKFQNAYVNIIRGVEVLRREVVRHKLEIPKIILCREIKGDGQRKFRCEALVGADERILEMKEVEVLLALNMDGVVCNVHTKHLTNPPLDDQGWLKRTTKIRPKNNVDLSCPAFRRTVIDHRKTNHLTAFTS